MNDTAVTKSDIKDVKDQIANLTELVVAGFETMNERFDRLEARVGKLEVRMDSIEGKLLAVEARLFTVERKQREAADWLQRLDGRLAGFESDVKELYGMAAETRKDFTAHLKKYPELDARLQKVERFARTAARKTGISFS